MRADWFTGTHRVTKMECRKNIGGRVSAKSAIEDWVFYINHPVDTSSDESWMELAWVLDIDISLSESCCYLFAVT